MAPWRSITAATAVIATVTSWRWCGWFTGNWWRRQVIGSWDIWPVVTQHILMWKIPKPSSNSVSKKNVLILHIVLKSKYIHICTVRKCVMQFKNFLPIKILLHSIYGIVVKLLVILKINAYKNFKTDNYYWAITG